VLNAVPFFQLDCHHHLCLELMRHFFRLVYVFGLTRLISTRQQPHAQVYPLGYIVVNVCDSLSEYSLLFF